MVSGMNVHTDKKIINQGLMVLIVLNIALALVSFLKDTLLASYLGTTGNGDALFAAFFLPDAIGFNILGQTASLVLVPVFVTLLSSQRKREALGIAYIAGLVAVIAAFVVSLLLLLGKNYSLMGIISGGDHIDKELSLTLLKTLIPILYIIPVAYICIAYLNAKNRFTATAVAPLVFNAFILFAVVLCIAIKVPAEKGIILIAAAISLASLFMAIYLFHAAGAFRKKLSVKAILAENKLPGELLQKLAIQTAYVVITFALYQSVLYFERFVANKICPGGISALNYSYRLAQFPLWVFISALLVVILPELSKNAALQNHKELYDKLHHAWMTLVMFITPVAVLMFILRREVLSLVFLRGAFGQESLRLTSQIMAGYSLSIIFQSLSYLLLRVYLVNGKMGRAFLSYLISSAFNIVFDIAAYRYLGLWAIGGGAMLGWLVNLLILFSLGEGELKRQIVMREPGIPGIIVGTNILAAVLGILGKRVLEMYLTLRSDTLNALILAVACSLIYLTVYLVLLLKFKIIQRIL